MKKTLICYGVGFVWAFILLTQFGSFFPWLISTDLLPLWLVIFVALLVIAGDLLFIRITKTLIGNYLKKIRIE